MAGHLLVFAAVLTCLRLGWWQWERTQETTGTAQNFGYALLWPAFGAAFVYMWVRFLHLEVLKDQEDDEDTERSLRALLDEGMPEHRNAAQPEQPSVAAGDRNPQSRDDASNADPDSDEPATPRPRRSRGDLQRPSLGITISVATVGEDDDEDPELTAYNQALAALAEEDRRRAR
jgi:DNA-binding transcriptional regulator of glucitol operon